MSSNDLKLWELDENYRIIADCIGIEAFNKLLWACAGEHLYIPKSADSAWRKERNRRIAADYNGGNIKELARKYSLTERRVQQIVNEMRETQ